MSPATSTSETPEASAAEEGARFKIWTTGANNWHVHAKHPKTGAWISNHGIYSNVAAMVTGDAYCDTLDAEARRQLPPSGEAMPATRERGH